MRRVSYDSWERNTETLKLGRKHGKDFRRVAIFGNKKWQEVAASVGSWFIGGEMKFFEDSEAALEWLDPD